MKTSDRCHLCKQPATLQLSHVVPKFAFRWLKTSSSTGYLRSFEQDNGHIHGERVNRRIQDGWKARWLCSNCEQLLGDYEKKFADCFFYPNVRRTLKSTAYGPWLLKFCVSLSWRSLKWFCDHDESHRYSEHLDTVGELWRRYLLDEISFPESYPQHLVLAEYASAKINETPIDINVYIRRGTNASIDTRHSPKFVVVKLPCFFVIGTLSEDNAQSWTETKVRANQGDLPFCSKLPKFLSEEILQQLRDIEHAKPSLSVVQTQKIRDTIETNPTRAANSDIRLARKFDKVARLL